MIAVSHSEFKINEESAEVEQFQGLIEYQKRQACFHFRSRLSSSKIYTLYSSNHHITGYFAYLLTDWRSSTPKGSKLSYSQTAF